MTRPLLQRCSGFTLIEIMFAAFASAIIFAALYGVFGSAMHLRENATVRTREAQMRSRAEAVIRKDLRNLYISTVGNNANGTTSANGTTLALAGTLTGTPQAHGSQFPGYVQFTATTAELSDDQVGGDVQTIEYYVTKDADPSNRDAGVLVRTESRIALLASTPPLPPEEPLLTRVTSLEVSFFDGNSWTPNWAFAGTADPLPQAVQVIIHQNDTTGHAAPPLEIIERCTAIPAAASTGAGS